MVDKAPEKTFPLYIWPPTATVRSRSLLKAGPVVDPGASVQASVTRNGRLGSAIVPVTVKFWPLAVNISSGRWSYKSRGGVSKAAPRFTAPIPWLLDQSVSFAPAPVR